MSSYKEKIALIGIGNILMGDDGFGPYLVRYLESHFRFSTEVVLVEAGTPGMDLLSLLSEYNHFILVDTIRAPGNPGEVLTYNMEAILTGGPGGAFSAHDYGLRQALLTLQLLGETPKNGVLIGVIPEYVDIGTELSDSVFRAIPKVIDEVTITLEKLDARIEQKAQPDRLDIWWKT